MCCQRTLPHTAPLKQKHWVQSCGEEIWAPTAQRVPASLCPLWGLAPGPFSSRGMSQVWVVTHELPLSVGDTPKWTGHIQLELGPVSLGSPKTLDTPGGISILRQAPGWHFLGGGGAKLNPAYLGAGTWDPLGSQQGEEEEEEAEIARLKAERWRKDLAPAETSCAQRTGRKREGKTLLKPHRNVNPGQSPGGGGRGCARCPQPRVPALAVSPALGVTLRFPAPDTKPRYFLPHSIRIKHLQTQQCHKKTPKKFLIWVFLLDPQSALLQPRAPHFLKCR